MRISFRLVRATLIFGFINILFTVFLFILPKLTTNYGQTGRYESHAEIHFYDDYFDMNKPIILNDDKVLFQVSNKITKISLTELSTTTPKQNLPLNDDQRFHHLQNDSNDTKYFNNLEYMYSIINNIKTQDLKRYVIKYRDFRRNEPLFPSEDDKKLFYQSERNVRNFVYNRPEQLIGVLEIIRNGTFKMFFDCGYKADSNKLRNNRPSDRHFKFLAPLIIPMGFLFQHFYDGTLPKLVQGWPILKRPEVVVLMERPFHQNIFTILSKFNITKERIFWHRRGDMVTTYSADYLINVCIAPPLHPDLWKGGRRFIGVPDSLVIPKSESKIMLLTRAGAVNPGRRIYNKRQVIAYLTARFGERLIVFNGKYTLDDAIKVFSTTSLIIGTHGGALYNMNYAPLDATIIEYVPMTKNGKDIPSLAHAIFWAVSDLTGQKYWRVQCYPVNNVYDMLIDLKKLSFMLDIIYPETKTVVDIKNWIIKHLNY